MIPLDLSLFGTDPWWLVLLKVVVLFVVLLVWTIFNVWYERRLVGKMQHRLGPIMNGPFGLLQAVADGAKLLLKEDFMPSKVDRVLFTLAPLVIVCLVAFTPGQTLSIPWGDYSLRWFRAVFEHSDLVQSFWNSLGVAAVAATVSVALAIPAGLAIARFEFRGRQALNGLLLSPLIVPHLVLGVAMLRLFALLDARGSSVWLTTAHVVIVTPYALRLVIAEAVTDFNQRLGLSDVCGLSGAGPVTNVGALGDVRRRELALDVARGVDDALAPEVGDVAPHVDAGRDLLARQRVVRVDHDAPRRRRLRRHDGGDVVVAQVALANAQRAVARLLQLGVAFTVGAEAVGRGEVVGQALVAAEGVV